MLCEKEVQDQNSLLSAKMSVSLFGSSFLYKIFVQQKEQV